MKNTLSVSLNGSEYYGGFIPNDDQNFKIGESVIVFHFMKNGNHWNRARKMREGDEEMLKKSHPNYGDPDGTEHYLVGKKTVTRIFNQKIWVK